LKPEIVAEVKRLRLFSLPVLSKEFVETARTKFNLQVHAWTINDEEQMRSVKEMGVDGIITDHPARLLSVLGRGATA
jgi:glycerophosphoryl diester phosphodiesterase